MDGPTENPNQKPKRGLPKHLKPGNPGNSGGKKGRSGRKPQDFIAWCKSVTDDETVRRVNEAKAKSGDIKVLDLAARYAHGVPKQQVEHTGELTVKVIRG